jgi:pyrroloquinoline quinone biosynthesis protein B
MLRILVLGAAAGGGLPQWNCNCANCREARAGNPAVPASTQASVAVSADSENWFLINASPDLRQQINANPQLHPRHGLRHSPIAGVILTNGDVDALAGLLTLREGSPFTIHAHESVLGFLRDNSIFNVLDPAKVKRAALEIGRTAALTLVDGTPSGLEVTAFAAPGKVPLYLEGTVASGSFATSEGETLGLDIREVKTGRRFVYLAACAAMTPEIAERLRGAPLVFFDGTLFDDDEMIRAGLSAKTGGRMGHISMSGENGAVAAFDGLGVGRKIFVHINNSNPALGAETPERRQLHRAGWEILRDGSEITL